MIFITDEKTQLTPGTHATEVNHDKALLLRLPEKTTSSGGIMNIANIATAMLIFWACFMLLFKPEAEQARFVLFVNVIAWFYVLWIA